MAELPTDRVALEKYMCVWFPGEVPEMVELRSMVMRCRWLNQLKANQMEDLRHLGVVNAFVDKMYVVIRKREKDVADMEY
ncbi:hypothetical protein Tco_0542587 [Tanacetum coccineum]